MVFMLAQIFGPISGAHFNPAVTIGMLFKEGNANWMRNFTFTLMLLIAQGIGAVIGCAICLGGFKLEKSDNAKVMNKDYYIA